MATTSLHETYLESLQVEELGPGMVLEVQTNECQYTMTPIYQGRRVMAVLQEDEPLDVPRQATLHGASADGGPLLLGQVVLGMQLEFSWVTTTAVTSIRTYQDFEQATLLIMSANINGLLPLPNTFPVAYSLAG